jgi:hypothetical protein
MEHTKVDLTVQVRQNLRTLADYLAALPEDYEHFEMSGFTYYRGGIVAGGASYVNVTLPDLNECGTAACACGHGPAAGIKPEVGDTWFSYSRKNFTEGNELLFAFLFAGAWSMFDNTTKGAAKRIKYFLEFGVPNVDDDDDDGVEHWDCYLRERNSSDERSTS